MSESIPCSDAALDVHVVRPDEGVLGALRVLAGVEQTRGMYFAFEMETAPSESPTALDVHAHAAYEESEYVLTGRREIVVGGEHWQAPPGFFALAPRHVGHGMRTIGAERSRWLHFFSPATIERYFVERERLRESGATAEELRALSQRYSVGEDAVKGPTEPAYASTTDTRRDGVIVSGRNTRNAYALVERSVLPEEYHEHADQEEAFYVISGELVVEVEGVAVSASERSFVLVPRGVRHRHVAPSGTSLLAIFSPGGAIPH
jgi:quercetin dioxygenase-like cupin family protein